MGSAYTLHYWGLNEMPNTERVSLISSFIHTKLFVQLQPSVTAIPFLMLLAGHIPVA